MASEDTRKKDLRGREIAAIQIAKKALALDDDVYRDLLERVAHVRSATLLDPKGRQLVLDELRRLGAPAYKPKAHPGKPNNLDAKPMLWKIEAFLAEAGREWAYADGIAKQMFGVERVQFCSAEQLRALIAALSRDAKRNGRRTK
jgi:phage gp16-like protein